MCCSSLISRLPTLGRPVIFLIFLDLLAFLSTTYDYDSPAKLDNTYLQARFGFIPLKKSERARELKGNSTSTALSPADVLSTFGCLLIFVKILFTCLHSAVLRLMKTFGICLNQG